MHTFQPIPVELFDFNPFEKIGNDWMLITTEADGKTNAMTASWGGLGVMWGKNAVFSVIRESRFTRELIDQSDSFSLSFFSTEYHSALKFMGAVSGRDEDKIKGARLNVQHKEGIPYFDEAATVILCKKMCKQLIDPKSFTMDWIDKKFYDDKNYHWLYIGEIVEIMAR